MSLRIHPPGVAAQRHPPRSPCSAVFCVCTQHLYSSALPKTQSMQLPAPPRAARRFSRRIDLRTVAPPRARSAAPPSGMMYATSLAILAPMEARPPPRWPETSYFCRPSVPASARVARAARAPRARCELGAPRASDPRSGGAWAAARGHRRAPRYCCAGGLRASRRRGAAAASECLFRVWGRAADLISAHGRRGSPFTSALGP